MHVTILHNRAAQCCTLKRLKHLLVGRTDAEKTTNLIQYSYLNNKKKVKPQKLYRRHKQAESLIYVRSRNKSRDWKIADCIWSGWSMLIRRCSTHKIHLYPNRLEPVKNGTKDRGGGIENGTPSFFLRFGVDYLIGSGPRGTFVSFN